MRFLTKPAGEGTVLGVSISHDIVVKQHGGSTEVNSSASSPKMRVILPRAPRYSPTNSQLADQRTPIVAFKPDGRLTSDADYLSFGR